MNKLIPKYLLHDLQEYLWDDKLELKASKIKIDNKKLEDQVKILQQENAELRAENIELNKLKSTLLLRIDKLIEENKEKTQAEVAEISNSDVLVESAEK